MTQQADLVTVAPAGMSGPVGPQGPIGPYGPAGSYGPAGTAPVQPPAGWGPPAQAPLNTMSVLSIVFLFVCSPAAVVCGVIARRQIDRTGERGRGMATTGVVVGAVSMVLGVLLAVLMVLGAASGAVTVTQTPAPAAAPSSAPAPAAPSTPGLTVSGPDIASSVVSSTGGLAQDVTCGDLPAQVGATTTCSATVNGRPTQLQVVATGVNGTHVDYSVRG